MRTHAGWLVAVLAVALPACGSDDSSNGSTPKDGGTGGATQDGSSGSGGTAGSQTGGAGGNAGLGGGGQAGAPNIEDAPSTNHSYGDDLTVFENPERGFYSAVNIVEDSDLSWVRNEGHTLAFSYVRLDDHREEPLPQSLLDAMDAGFDVVRDAGLKVILRFAYNFGPWPDSEPDAPKSWVLQHIAQVQPYLEKHADVILLVQAGFIGAWGEWHTSTNGLLDDAADRLEIVQALLDAIPTDRMTQIRYPAYKLEMYGDPVGAAEAFDGSDKARVGHHNDCFLASDTDMGTYDNRGDVPPRSIDEWKSFVADDTRFLPMGGETCQVSSRSECPTALAEMEMLHFSYINEDYHQDVVASWAPCREEMDRSIGYRFHLAEAAYPSEVRPGGTFRLTMSVRNDGWARLFNPRSVVVVLRGASTYEVTLDAIEPRQWGPGETTELDVRLGLPADITPGSYQLAIWLPDEGAELRDRPEYSVRMAGGVTWNTQTGDNEVGVVQIDDQAPGGTDPSANAFRVISYD